MKEQRVTTSKRVDEIIAEIDEALEECGAKPPTEEEET